jgi:hypothetical protein
MTYHFPYLSEHQSRTIAPTDWEMSLAGALEAIYATGTHDLDGVVAGLNNSRVRPRQGGSWTAETFTATLRDLGE